MIQKVSQRELKSRERKGARVKRQMGAAEPVEKPVAAPKPEVQPHAAMAASLEASDANQRATNILLARNTEIIAEFGKSLAKAATREPSPYTFDIERDDDKLLKRVLARPGIKEA
jgi:hypothetical protein